MRSFNRLIWLFMLLCLAVLAISTTVKCLTEEKEANLDWDDDMLDNVDYDEGYDESENEKAEYSAVAAPPPPPPPPAQSNYYQPPQASYGAPPAQASYSAPATPSYSAPASAPAQQSYSSPPAAQAGYSAPPPPPSYSQPSQYNLVPLPNYTVPVDSYLEPPPPPEPIYESLVPVYQPVTVAPAANYSQPQPVYETVTYAQPPPPVTYSQPPAPALTYSHPAPAYKPANTSYSAPAPAQQSYSAPTYQQSYATPAQQSYAPPAQQSYATPAQQSYAPPAQQSYAPPAQQSYTPPPQQNYSAPAPAQQSYSAPPAQQSYNAPQAQQSYAPPAQQSYTPPPQQNYSAPAPAQQSYSAPPAQQSYAPPAQQSYTPPPQQNYSIPAPAQQSYSAPPAQPAYTPPPRSSYQPPAMTTNYHQPTAPPTSYQANYSKPVVVVPPPAVYQPPPPQQTYQKPQQNYSTPAVYQPSKQQAATYKAVQPIVYRQPMQQYLPALIQKYSAAELAPFISPYNYRSNHWSLFYYRGAQNPYLQRLCPKSPYAHGPNYRDIEQAFIEALAQLGQYRQPAYSNASHPSFASRHQIFSLLSQQSARMDEEGLLVEMVSRYLADRLCLTKWDKQRYLPQLTKFISSGQFPAHHSCANYYRNPKQGQAKECYNRKYRTIDGFCNNPYHPYWGKANVCHIRLLSPDYADGISLPRVSINPRYPLPNPRQISNIIHNDIYLEGPYNLMKMQWGQFINHDITSTALSAYDGLVDCCRQPQARGCWPIYVPPGDRFYGPMNVTCLNFIRSGVCPLCQLGPRQQSNKNTAYLDASHVYGNSDEQALKLRTFRGGLLKTSSSRNGEQLLPIASTQEQCHSPGACYEAGDSRVNQHPALTALHVLLLRNHNYHAQRLAQRHPQWSDEELFQEARRINIAEYQMITYNEYLPIVFGPILSAYYHLTPQRSGNTYYNPQVDPTTWNEYSTATCRFGHSQIQSTFGLYTRIMGYGQQDAGQPSFRLKEWFMRPTLLNDNLLVPIINGLLARPSQVVDPWITSDVRNHLYQSHREHSGGDLAATNIWRGRDHGIPGYVHYVEYCFNHKVRGWRDLALFIPPTALTQLRRLYRVVENIDLFSGGLAERHFPGADIGPTFACVNGIQYYHLKFGDRYYFEHGGQAGSFSPPQLDEIRRSTLARLLCRTAYLPQVPQYAFMAPSMYNPLVNCSQIAEFNHNAF